jgi:hypothetical protein
MYTSSAVRSMLGGNEVAVHCRRTLEAQGWSASAITAQLDARRWQRWGRAIILHNGELSPDEFRIAALVHHGPRAVLTSHTAAQLLGLSGWSREDVHVLVPRGARIRPLPGTRLHFTDRWDVSEHVASRRIHRLAPALALAASGFTSARPACGILAAGVQQRLVRPATLRQTLTIATRIRHRHVLLKAVDDIEQGSHALTEIDFIALCRREGLPRPSQQSVRRAPDGRRRYLDAVWELRDGRRVVAEIDGANHLRSDQWMADTWRQNELVIDGDFVLRYPSILFRSDPAAVAAQLRRALT